jgi:hypothetical protein
MIKGLLPCLSPCRSITYTLLTIMPVILITMAGCHIWPAVEFDFSRLGNTPLDELVTNDNTHPILEPITPPDARTSSSAPLPPTHHLVRQVNSLLYANGDSERVITPRDVEHIGAVCLPNKQSVCVYQGVVISNYYANGSVIRSRTSKYTIVFNLNTRPVDIEVRITSADDTQATRWAVQRRAA